MAEAKRIPSELTDFRSPQQFLTHYRQLVLSVNAKIGDILAHEEELNPAIGQYCMQYFQRMRTAPDYLLIGHGLICRHPHFPDQIYQLTFSERSPGAIDERKLLEDANWFFRSMEFQRVSPSVDRVAMAL